MTDNVVDISTRVMELTRELETLGEMTHRISKLSPASRKWLARWIEEDSLVRDNPEPEVMLEDVVYFYETCGYALRHVADLYDVSHETVRHWLLLAGIDRRGFEEEATFRLERLRKKPKKGLVPGDAS